MVDLSTCKKGDLLLSSQNLILEYVSPTPLTRYCGFEVETTFSYLDHVVKYTHNGSLVTRTNDGFAFRLSRRCTDNDIVKIL